MCAHLEQQLEVVRINDNVLGDEFSARHVIPKSDRRWRPRENGIATDAKKWTSQRRSEKSRCGKSKIALEVRRVGKVGVTGMRIH